MPRVTLLQLNIQLPETLVSELRENLKQGSTKAIKSSFTAIYQEYIVGVNFEICKAINKFMEDGFEKNYLSKEGVLEFENYALKLISSCFFEMAKNSLDAVMIRNILANLSRADMASEEIYILEEFEALFGDWKIISAADSLEMRVDFDFDPENNNSHLIIEDNGAGLFLVDHYKFAHSEKARARLAGKLAQESKAEGAQGPLSIDIKAKCNDTYSDTSPIRTGGMGKGSDTEAKFIAAINKLSLDGKKIFVRAFTNRTDKKPGIRIDYACPLACKINPDITKILQQAQKDIKKSTSLKSTTAATGGDQYTAAERAAMMKEREAWKPSFKNWLDLDSDDEEQGNNIAMCDPEEESKGPGIQMITLDEESDDSDDEAELEVGGAEIELDASGINVKLESDTKDKADSAQKNGNKSPAKKSARRN